MRYSSNYGQNFFVCGNIPELGENNHEKAVPLSYLNDEFWHGIVEIPDNIDKFSYKYFIRYNDGIESTEWRADREVNISKVNTAEVQLVDTWNYTGQYENAFFTQPFTQTLLKPNKHKYSKSVKANATHIFRVKAPLLHPDEVVCLLGSTSELGNWDETNPVLMEREGPWYTCHVNLANGAFPLYYKYGVYHVPEKRFVRYEDGENRMLYGIGIRQTTFLHDGFIRLPNNTFKGAGIAIPVFSLRSEKSLGIGEFSDIRALVDWSGQVGLKLIQLLPVNDTTVNYSWTDSYPYAPVSVFALHPIYLNIEQLAGKEHAALIKTAIGKKKELNNHDAIDYDAVIKLKWTAIKALYKAMKEAWLDDKDYQPYFRENEKWLVPYAAFCYFRDKNKTADFSQWKTNAVYNEKEVAKLANPKSKTFDQFAIHLFVQYYLHVQLKDAVEYAHANGVILKGDLPIGIYRNSADAWMQPELYNMDAQAGAPPDDFAVKGQNWGFPTYNWNRMAEDGFAWWKERFKQMSLYFDAFRIDHILGFFRIWSIPMNAVQGILGHFVPCIPVHMVEFSERGIWFDYDRYCKPFINDNILFELFGEKTEWVKQTFLDHNGWGSYTLKEEVNNQRKIEKWFEGFSDTDLWVKDKLFDLVSNIILIPEVNEKGETVYHFRIAMEDTLSFRYLDENTRNQLKDLYVNYFFRRQDDFWRQQAMQKLPALKSATEMLVCGEDLGMVPDCVPGVMRDTGLLSLEIQRMPKDPTRKFFHPADAPYMSVVTPSTHDMSTIRGWWEEARDNTRQFFQSELGQGGEPPFYCEPWINKAIISQHVYSPAMWSIFQLQDLLGIDGELRRENPHDERINVPANPKHYWRYRMHLTLEDLQKADHFNSEVRSMLEMAGRV
ncbi:MAG: 4-alpha-glucanotransferase [Chitinophagaceae bacterium]|nr:4-alpha-glucanotransferase [Chitinophagaceae bacterium]